MPFKSDAQRRFMYAKHPRIAARWSKETPKGKDLPEHVKKAVDAAKATFSPLEIKLPPQPKPLEVAMPLPGSIATPISAPSLGKLKAVATRKLGSADDQKPTTATRPFDFEKHVQAQGGEHVLRNALVDIDLGGGTVIRKGEHILLLPYDHKRQGVPILTSSGTQFLIGHQDPEKTSAELSGEDIAAQLKAHDRPDSEFRPDQLAKGIEVEREHSESLPIRKAITKGHLVEFDNYYDPLAKMEDELKAGKTAAYGLGVHHALQQFSKTAGIPIFTPLIGAGIGALAAGPENRGRGALMGAGAGLGAALGGQLGMRLTRYTPGALATATQTGAGALGNVLGGIGGYHAGRAIAPERRPA